MVHHSRASPSLGCIVASQSRRQVDGAVSTRETIQRASCSYSSCRKPCIRVNALATVFVTAAISSAFAPPIRRCRLEKNIPAFSSPWTSPSSIPTIGTTRQEQQLSAVPVAAAASLTKSAVSTSTKAPFWQLAVAFLLGGIFCSTLVAALGTAYSFGLKNIIRLIRFGLVVVYTVVSDAWGILYNSVVPVMSGKRSDKSNKSRLKETWEALIKGWAKAKKSAADNIDALRLERNLLAASVGPPGLVPLQYALDRIVPLSLAGPMEKAFREACTEVKNPFVRTVTLKKFDVGEATPKLEQGLFYELGKEQLAFDVDVVWDSQIDATVDIFTKRVGARVPVSIKGLKFEGPVRVIVASLRKDEPGYGAMLVSLPEPPKIGLECKVLGGELTKVPWLRSELTKGLQSAIADEVLWPRRIVVPAVAPPRQIVPVMTRKQLDQLQNEDPLLLAEQVFKARFKTGVAAMAVGKTASGEELETSLDIDMEDDTTEKEKELHDTTSTNTKISGLASKGNSLPWKKTAGK